MKGQAEWVNRWDAEEWSGRWPKSPVFFIACIKGISWEVIYGVMCSSYSL